MPSVNDLYKNPKSCGKCQNDFELSDFKSYMLSRPQSRVIFCTNCQTENFALREKSLGRLLFYLTALLGGFAIFMAIMWVAVPLTVSRDIYGVRDGIYPFPMIVFFIISFVAGVILKELVMKFYDWKFAIKSVDKHRRTLRDY